MWFFSKPYIDSQKIEIYLHKVRAKYPYTNLPTITERWSSQAVHRGPYRFTITEADLQKKESELHTEGIQPSFCSNSKSEEETLFVRVLLWTLNQEEISCNQISEYFSVGWRRANNFIKRLCDLGIVGKLDAKLPRKVLVHSVKDASPAVAELLRKNGFNAPHPEAKKKNANFRNDKATSKICEYLSSLPGYLKR